MDKTTEAGMNGTELQDKTWDDDTPPPYTFPNSSIDTKDPSSIPMTKLKVKCALRSAVIFSIPNL